MDLNKFIKHKLIDLGLQKKQFSAQVGTSDTYIGMVLNGKVNPSAQLMKSMVRVLRPNQEELIELADYYMEKTGKLPLWALETEEQRNQFRSLTVSALMQSVSNVNGGGDGED